MPFLFFIKTLYLNFVSGKLNKVALYFSKFCFAKGKFHEQFTYTFVFTNAGSLFPAR